MKEAFTYFKISLFINSGVTQPLQRFTNRSDFPEC